MIIVLIFISIAIIILGLYLNKDINTEDSGMFLTVAGTIGFAIKIIALIILLNSLINIRVVDEKIELYTKQNKEIENKIELVVNQYMEHENKTFSELKTTESYITLVTLYPELKSDKLIEKEITLYEENNEKIISLKEQKINEKIYKWWLYFGK